MWDVLLFSTIAKALLFRAYRSTDFEVHRNWLAITHSLPISQWYFEKTSEWTLDYPPFFAWFERTLSMFAPLADPKMLKVQSLDYASDATVYFQRGTVIASELVLFWALERYRQAFGSKTANYIIAASVLLHPGLFIVDHILLVVFFIYTLNKYIKLLKVLDHTSTKTLTHMHFQYNGFLYGILVLSIVEAKKGNLLMSGILFAVLLNFKHIFLYMAPAYFVYLLKAYCFQTTATNSNDRPGDSPPKTSFSILNFITLGGSVIFAFALSFGPFAYLDQMPQVFSRLFPFTRGLCHALWAPNFWALYAGADRVLIIVGKRLGWALNEAALGSMTRGYVGDTSFAVLPPVEAIHTLLATLTFQMVTLQILWHKPTFNNFLSALTLCGFASFLFGWHVHEKAILLVLIPFSLMATNSRENLKIFIILSTAGIYSLYPLLFQVAETPVKLIITAVWMTVVFAGLAHEMQATPYTLLHPLEIAYLAGFIPLHAYAGTVHPLLFGPGRLEFLPLMMTSVYCALGVCYAWARFTVAYLVGGLVDGGIVDRSA